MRQPLLSPTHFIAQINQSIHKYTPDLLDCLSLLATRLGREQDKPETFHPLE